MTVASRGELVLVALEDRGDNGRIARVTINKWGGAMHSAMPILRKSAWRDDGRPQ
jgi:hypothetical protein